VKDVWALYISMLDIKVPNLTQPKPRKEKDSDSASEEDEEEFSTREEGDTSASEARSESGYKFRSDLRELNRYPPLRISITFLYIATVILKLPVLLNEIYL
jgi:hypothetical protein